MVSRTASRLLAAYEWFERTVYAALLLMLMIVVGWSTVSLAMTIGGFLMILIGIELMRTIVVYLAQHELHVEVVFTVAMIAIARHAIDLNLTEISPLTLIGMGVLILSFAAGRHFYHMSTAAKGEHPASES